MDTIPPRLNATHLSIMELIAPEPSKAHVELITRERKTEGKVDETHAPVPIDLTYPRNTHLKQFRNQEARGEFSLSRRRIRLPVLE